MLFFKKKFFPIKTTIFVHKENSYYTMNHTVEDLSLFNALRQGDGNSFDHLFRRYYPMLCAYAHRLVSLEDAEEIVQCQYLQPIITQYFIDNKSEIWLLFLIAHSKR